MARNRHRDSAGRSLIGYGALLLIVCIVTVQDWWQREDIEWAELPTAVEDQEYYRPLGSDDFSDPNLRFSGAPGEGLVRKSPTPLALRDFRMRKLRDIRGGYLRDETNSLFIYRYDKDSVDPETGAPERYFVKVADDQFIRFAPLLAAASAVPPTP